VWRKGKRMEKLKASPRLDPAQRRQGNNQNMSKAKTQEEQIAAQVVAEASAAKVAQGSSGLATPKETVNITISAVLNEKASDGSYYALAPQIVPMDRPKGLPTLEADRMSVAQAWSLIANNGGMTFRDANGKVHIYPLTTIHHLEVEVSAISGITL